jgi:hypothetical protein
MFYRTSQSDQIEVRDTVGARVTKQQSWNMYVKFWLRKKEEKLHARESM